MNESRNKMGVPKTSESLEMPSMSVIIPAFNEEGYLPQTLNCLKAAVQQFRTVSDATVQIIVVDNASCISLSKCNGVHLVDDVVCGLH